MPAEEREGINAAVHSNVDEREGLLPATLSTTHSTSQGRRHYFNRSFGLVTAIEKLTEPRYEKREKKMLGI